MSEEDKERLSDELLRPVFRAAKEPVMPFFGPRTHEEKIDRIKEAEENIKNGNVRPLDDLLEELEKEYPWLAE